MLTSALVRLVLLAFPPRSHRLYLAFHSKREEELLAELGDFRLARGRKLGYMSVKQKTQRHLFLYESVADM